MTPCAVIIGVGASQGIGAAVCRRAAQAGLLVYVVGRTTAKVEQIVTELQAFGGQAIAYTLDATDTVQVKQLFATLMHAQHQPVLVVHNVGSNMPSRFLATPLVFFGNMWRHTFLSAVVTSQAALDAMQPFAQGTILLTGASASLRGKPNFSAFTTGKGSLRAYSQLLAEHAVTKGIHVAHVIIDGMVDGDRINQFAGGIGRLVRWGFKGKHGSLNIDDIAEQYWLIHQQQTSLWISELDLRPFKEVF
jgi:NADP-dependent 3-hydroxy acid dehydrogenase YdfG